MNKEQLPIQSRSSEPNLKAKTAKGLFWGGLSNAIQQLLALVFGIFLARELNPDEYGLIGMLSIFTAVASIIINSGFSIALTNKRDASQKDYDSVFWFSFIAGLFLYIILYFCAPLIADFYEKPELTKLSRFIFISFFFSAIAIVPHTIMYKHLMVKQQAIIDNTATFLSGVIGIILAIKGYSYWALAIQSMVSTSVGSCLKFFFSPWRPTFSFDLPAIRGMFSFSSKILFANISQQVNSNIFSVLIGKFFNETQLGYYSQGQKWMGMLHQLVGGMINMVAQPVIVTINNDKERETRVFRKMMRFIAFISFPAFLGLAFIAKEFILITIGEKWLPSVIFLQILCGWGIVAPFFVLFSQLIVSHGKSTIYLKGILLTGISQIIIFIITYKWGLLYMAVGYVVNFLLSMFFWYYYVKKHIDIKITQICTDIFPYLITSALSISLSVFLTSYIDNIYVKLICKIVFTTFSYLSILWIFKSKILMEILLLVKNKYISWIKSSRFK